MKHTKRLLAAVMALTMVSAVAPMSAFAITQDDIDPDTGKATGEMTATYDVTAKYTVTIPAGVTLDAEADVTSEITAENVLIEKGDQVVVKLTGGTNTTEGSTFHAKKGDSTAEYTISAGTPAAAVSVGDTVATFSNGTAKQTSTLTFSKPTGWTAAGEHTETLTFTIAVEKPAAPSLADAFNNGAVIGVVVNTKMGGTNTFAFTYNNGTFTPINPDGQNGYTYNYDRVSLTEDNGSLVIKTMSYPDGSLSESFNAQYVRTYTFNTSNNTYTYTPPTTETDMTQNNRTFNSISVNGTEIPVTLES